MKKTALAVGSAVAIALTLAGRSSYPTAAEVTSTPGYVVQLTESTWDDWETFEYVAQNGETIALPNCELPGFFDYRYCESENGVVRFEWGTGKYGISHAVLYNDGVAHELQCDVYDNGEDFWYSLEYCYPS